MPNSWECPRCVKSGSKSNSKSKSKSSSCPNWSQMKKEDFNNSQQLGEKRFRIEDESPPSTEDEEEDNSSNNTANKSALNTLLDNNNDTEDENSSGSSHTDNNQNSLINFQSKPYSLLANNSAHVRSCARFPLLSQGLKMTQNQNNSSLISSGNKNGSLSLNGNKSEVKGLAALMNSKKKSETSRDRLFKSLKGFDDFPKIFHIF